MSSIKIIDQSEKLKILLGKYTIRDIIDINALYLLYLLSQQLLNNYSINSSNTAIEIKILLVSFTNRISLTDNCTLLFVFDNGKNMFNILIILYYTYIILCGKISDTFTLKTLWIKSSYGPFFCST